VGGTDVVSQDSVHRGTDHAGPAKWALGWDWGLCQIPPQPPQRGRAVLITARWAH
jgi:hypothetical protein